MLLALVLALVPPAAQATTQEFTILATGTHHRSELADELAMDYARKRAVYLAVRKLGVGAASDVAAKIPLEEYPRIIRGATVLQSKRKGYSTYSEIRVTVVDDALRRALKIAETVPEKDPVNRAVLVLPVLYTPAHTYVWDKEHPLKPVLSAELLKAAHGAIMMPGGDLQDLRLIDHDNAATVKAEELKPMFARYGVGEIIIAMVKPAPVGETAATAVLLRRLSETGAMRPELMEIPPDNAEETQEKRVERAARAVAAAALRIASSTAGDERHRRDMAQKLEVRITYATPRELAEIQRAVRAQPQVVALELPAIALQQVRGILYVQERENLTALKEALIAKGVRVRSSGEAWLLSVR